MGAGYMHGAALPGQGKAAGVSRSAFQELCHLEQGLCFLFRQDTDAFQKLPLKSGRVHHFGISIQKFGERSAEAGEELLQYVDGGLVLAPLNLVDVVFGHIGFFGKTVYAEPFAGPQLSETVWNINHGCHPFLPMQISGIGNLLEPGSRPAACR